MRKSEPNADDFNFSGFRPPKEVRLYASPQVTISRYPSRLYAAHLAGWRAMSLQVNSHAAVVNETIWFNFAAGGAGGVHGSGDSDKGTKPNLQTGETSGRPLSRRRVPP
ncbi:MAG: hypothetical protein OXC53_08700 [Rhodobacteraceae bacterium]|nr:hypothetical protein [Paracoccaceae bacterium]